MRHLSEPSDTNDHAERERNIIAVCDLADDLRDVVVDYQVSTGIKKRTQDSSLTRPIALAAEGNLQPELYIDCKSQDPRFDKALDIDRPLQDAGQA